MIHVGDCLEVMRTLPEASVDAVVTDPPYALEFMGKGWDKFGAVIEHPDDGEGPWGRTKRVRYGKSISGFQQWCEAWGREALRVTVPGGYLLAFGGTRTHHRLVCGLEDAGWIIRDELTHIYASGFPKSHNVSKSERFCQCERALSTAKHRVRSVPGADVSPSVAASTEAGSVLFPSLPLAGGAPDSDPARGLSDGAQSGLEGRRDVQEGKRQLSRGAGDTVPGVGEADGSVQRVRRGASAGDGSVDGSPVGADRSGQPPRPRSREQRPSEPRAVAVERDAQGRRGWPLCDRCGKPMVSAGLGTALKPAHEPIILARKPLAGSVAENVERYGTGALNIDGTRIPGTEAQEYTVKRLKPGATLNKTGGNWRPEDGPDFHGKTQAGRWPSNVLLSTPELFDVANPEVVGSGATASFSSGGQGEPGTPKAEGWGTLNRDITVGYGDTGGYSRFFRIPNYGCPCCPCPNGPYETGQDRCPLCLKGQHVDSDYPKAFLIPKADRADREPVLRGQLPKTGTGLHDDDGYRQPGERKANHTAPHPRENSHATVKPTDLMRHLVRLVTPSGGTVLDPFLGSGSTAIACEMEGFAWIGIEKEAEYVAIAEARLNGVQKGLGLDVPAPTRKRVSKWDDNATAKRHETEIRDPYAFWGERERPPKADGAA